MLSRVIRFFTESWGLKLAALGLAILLWMAVTANQPQRAAFRNVPVEVDVRDPDWRLIGPPEPENVTVTVEGPRGGLVELSGQSFRIGLPVDRVNDTVESHVVSLPWVQQQIPPALRITVLDVRPDTITLRYQRLARRMIPVRVRTRGSLPDSLALSTVSTNPTAVQVRGPASILAELDSVPLFPVDLEGLRSTTNLPVGVDTTELAGLSFQPLDVTVVLRVVPADTQRPPERGNGRAGAPF